MITVYISGNRARYERGSLLVDMAVDERSVARFTVVDADGDHTYQDGQPVEVYSGADLIFGGVIHGAPRRRISIKRTEGYEHRVVCADWHYLADKRIVSKAYQDELAGDIVRDIHTTYLDDEGITIGQIDDGPVGREVVFNYIDAARCLTRLKEKAGFWWLINAAKEIFFVERSTYAAPWTLTHSDCERGSIKVERSNPQYRNRQYVRGTTAETDPQIEVTRGDGEARAFVAGYRLAKVPTVEVKIGAGAWTAQDVGIKGLETGKHWYWSKGDPVLLHDEGEAALTDADFVRVTYEGQIDLVVLSQESAAIVDRLALEGAGTGYVESVVDDFSLTTRAAAFELASDKLKQYATIGSPPRLTVRTWRGGLLPGQLLTVNLPEDGLIGEDMLIEAVTITDEAEDLTWYTVKAASGPPSGSWAQYFAALVARAEAFVVRENIREDQVLITLAQFSKDWLEPEHPNPMKTIFPGGTLFPAADLYPMFQYEDRLKYMSWYDGATELARKIITTRTGLDTDEVFTLTYVAPHEMNVPITHLGWWGGAAATEALGTGIEIAKVSHVMHKAEGEAVQVERTDRKGW